MVVGHTWILRVLIASFNVVPKISAEICGGCGLPPGFGKQLESFVFVFLDSHD